MGPKNGPRESNVFFSSLVARVDPRAHDRAVQRTVRGVRVGYSILNIHTSYLLILCCDQLRLFQAHWNELWLSLMDHQLSICSQCLNLVNRVSLTL